MRLRDKTILPIPTPARPPAERSPGCLPQFARADGGTAEPRSPCRAVPVHLALLPRKCPKSPPGSSPSRLGTHRESPSARSTSGSKACGEIGGRDPGSLGWPCVLHGVPAPSCAPQDLLAAPEPKTFPTEWLRRSNLGSRFQSLPAIFTERSSFQQASLFFRSDLFTLSF